MVLVKEKGASINDVSISLGEGVKIEEIEIIIRQTSVNFESTICYPQILPKNEQNNSILVLLGKETPKILAENFFWGE